MASQLHLQPEQKDELLTVLADGTRRAILTTLQDADDGIATVQELTNQIDKHDHGGPDVTPVQLVHSDLPRLEETGAVEFDQRSKTVRYQGFTELERLLELVDDL